ncbi:MAG: hypothetical protein P8O16_01265 [Algoriphagus sp.]|uniref:hypothetical protein n=1 Tax=Algoriphagus sp. TaxID=1872435 RepID=UPI0026038C38|nr:hypothetical protein [Algoriphagus sp.]MDG1275877.1 hypothetical protein [Algoriphagus sp.]
MKKLLSTYGIGALTLLVFSLMSCNSDSDEILKEPDLSIVNDDYLIAQAFEDLDNITLTALNNSGLGARITKDVSLTEICASATANLDETGKKITIDFGAGCTSSNGITRKGKIILSYSGNLLFPGSQVITTFDGYHVNDKKIEGTRTITNTGIDFIGGTVSLAVKVENGKITWPDNTFITVASNQIRVVKLGGDGYEASITGTATGKSREGVVYSTLVIDPLIIKQTCVETGVWVPGTGTLQFLFTGIEVTVDYGTGVCDKMVTIIYPGGSKEVTLD